jgi:hypothetical protein
MPRPLALPVCGFLRRCGRLGTELRAVESYPAIVGIERSRAVGLSASFPHALQQFSSADLQKTKIATEEDAGRLRDVDGEGVFERRLFEQHRAWHSIMASASTVRVVGRGGRHAV